MGVAATAPATTIPPASQRVHSSAGAVTSSYPMVERYGPRFTTMERAGLADLPGHLAARAYFIPAASFAGDIDLHPRSLGLPARHFGSRITVPSSMTVQYTLVASTPMPHGWFTPEASVVGAPPAIGTFITVPPSVSAQ